MDKLREWLSGERGRVVELAAACGITHGAVSQWQNVPLNHLRMVEHITGIPREELRPDVYGQLPRTESAA
jgi:DNA-binding transcriptional regulator YdaS (Cro superfamily)